MGRWNRWYKWTPSFFSLSQALGSNRPMQKRSKTTPLHCHVNTATCRVALLFSRASFQEWQSCGWHDTPIWEQTLCQVLSCFLQHSATNKTKHHTTPTLHDVWVLYGADDYTHNVYWHRKRGGKRSERRYASDRESRCRKTGTEIEKKLSDAALICHA